jgi:galactokinase
MAGSHREPEVRAMAPGRVNLIGDHTDTTGGLVLPMAVDRTTVVTGQRTGHSVTLTSEGWDGRVDVDLSGRGTEPLPGWGRYVAAVVSEVRPNVGFTGGIRSSVPPGSGLSSSAALTVATALALGFEGRATDLALLAQRAEQRAVGVPCGIMDQLASSAAVAGHALLIDCTTLETSPVPMPSDLEVVVVDSGQARSLEASGYTDVVARCQEAAALLGPLTEATVVAAREIGDPSVRGAAVHVISENRRVRDAADALEQGDLTRFGRLAIESHRSLATNLGVSTARLDQLVAELCEKPGVLGARLTGAGFGGSVVAFCRPGALDGAGTVVRPSGPARVEIA